MAKNPESDQLQITNNILKCGNEIYQLRNLVRIGKFKGRKNNGFLILLFIAVVFGTFVIGSRQHDILPLGIGLAIVLLVIIGLRRPKYALRIETNSGSGELLWTREEHVIDELINLISSVLENQDREVNYMVNMNDHSVKELVMGDKFKSIENAVIATRGAVVKGGRSG